MTDARTQAVAAGNEALKARYGYEPASGNPEDAYWVHALDAIPAPVLAAYLLERGALQQVAWRFEWRDGCQTRPGYMTYHAGEVVDSTHERLYRITEEAQP